MKTLNQISIKLERKSQEKDLVLLDNRDDLNMFEKLDYYETNSQGLVVNPHVNEACGSEKTFQTLEAYLLWKNAVKSRIVESIRLRLTPQEYNVVMNQATEEPFTGVYANHYDVGMYSCKVCTQKLFSNTHKVVSDAGWAMFWNYVPFSVRLKSDSLGKFGFERRSGRFPLQHDDLGVPEKRLACSNVSDLVIA